MPNPIAAVVGGSSVLGGAMQSRAASKAADAQVQAAREQMQLQREMYDATRADLSPFRTAGGNALQAYMSELGLGAAPDGYTGISMSPAAQYALTQGTDSIQASAAARGGLRSGSALQSLEGFRFGLAANDRDNQLNRLAGLSDMGVGAASMNQQNANSLAAMGSTSLANRGNAQSAGYIGAGNAWANGLGQLGGMMGYMKGMT